MALTPKEVATLKEDYLKNLDALVEARLQEKQKDQRLAWDKSDTGIVFMKWSQQSTSDVNSVFFNEQSQWIYEQTKRAAQQKRHPSLPVFDETEDPNYFGPKDKKTAKLASPRLSISEEAPPQTASSKPDLNTTIDSLGPPPPKHPFDKELTQLGTHINKLEALELKGKLSKGVKFLGIQFKSDQQKKLKEAKDMYTVLEKTNNQYQHALTRLHNRIESAITANKNDTGGALLHGTGELDKIYNNVLSKIESYAPELKQEDKKGAKHPPKKK